MSVDQIFHTDVLMTARDLVARRDGWTQETYARDAHGVGTDPLGPDAICFCATGAIIRAVGPGPDNEYDQIGPTLVLNSVIAADSKRPLDYSPVGRTIAQVIAGIKGFPGIWNDIPSRTQAEVVAMFDRAIERERKRFREWGRR